MRRFRQHNSKKIRNHILKSSFKGGTRCLKVRENTLILWEHLVYAFHFDQKEFSLSYHHKLTMNHFELGPASKMWNHLAEDVVDKNMLNLMKVFLSHLINICVRPTH